MRIQSRGAGGFKLVRREQGFQSFAFLLPLFIERIKDLRKAAPADVAHQHSLFIFGRRSSLRFEVLEQFDGREIVSAFLLERADADLVLIGNPIIILVSERLGFGNDRFDRGDPLR